MSEATPQAEGIKLAFEVLKALLNLSVLIFGAMITFLGETYTSLGLGYLGSMGLALNIAAIVSSVLGLFACVDQTVNGTSDAADPGIRISTMAAVGCLLAGIAVFGIHIGRDNVAT